MSSCVWSLQAVPFSKPWLCNHRITPVIFCNFSMEIRRNHWRKGNLDPGSTERVPICYVLTTSPVPSCLSGGIWLQKGLVSIFEAWLQRMNWVTLPRFEIQCHDLSREEETMAYDGVKSMSINHAAVYGHSLQIYGGTKSRNGCSWATVVDY